MFEKRIYTGKYKEIINNFKRIVNHNIPVTLYKTNYAGWAKIFRIFEKQYKCIKYGNLSYFITFEITYDKNPHLSFKLTDDDNETSYFNEYYYLLINDNEKEIIKLKEKRNKEYRVKIYCNSCEFAYINDSFIMLTRNDVDHLYYFICFGKNTKMFDKIYFINKVNFYEEMKNIYDEQIFIRNVDEIVMNTIVEDLTNSIREKNSIKLKNLFDAVVNYTDINTYGFYEANITKKLNELLENNILKTKTNVCRNEIEIAFQIELIISQL